MNVEDKELPEYQTPPVIEVVCGVQYKPADGLTVGHLGHWWSTICNEFPTCQEADPIFPQIERFDQAPGSEVVIPAIPRLWLTTKSGDQLIQLQKDRFLFNWRKIGDDHAYPRYEFVRSLFDKYRDAFTSFVSQTTGTSLQPIQYELSYVNHILDGADSWKSPEEIGRVLSAIAWRHQPERVLPSPETLDLQMSFLLPNHAARLHARARTARRKVDNRSVILLELTARGFGDDLHEWFSMAHEWIIRGFTDLTTEEAHQRLWYRTK